MLIYLFIFIFVLRLSSALIVRRRQRAQVLLQRPARRAAQGVSARQRRNHRQGQGERRWGGSGFALRRPRGRRLATHRLVAVNNPAAANKSTAGRSPRGVIRKRLFINVKSRHEVTFCLSRNRRTKQEEATSRRFKATKCSSPFLLAARRDR